MKSDAVFTPRRDQSPLLVQLESPLHTEPTATSLPPAATRCIALAGLVGLTAFIWRLRSW